MRTTNDAEKDKIVLRMKRDEDISTLNEANFSVLLRNTLRKTIEQYYKPMIQALDIEYSVREEIEDSEK